MRGRQLLLSLGLAAVLVSQIIVVILSLSFQHANAQIPSFKISQDNNPAQDTVYFASGVSVDKDSSYSNSFVHLKGYIINRGSELATLVQVTATFYNMANQVIEKDSTYPGDIPNQ